MKIWVIGRSYPEPKNDMKGSFEFEQAQLLAKKGNQVTYLAVVFHPFKRIKKWGYASWEENGIKVCTYSQFYALERMKLRWKWFQELRWRELLNLVEKEGGTPDVIHIHYPSMITEPDVILPYRNKGTRIVFTEHWTHVLTNELDSHERAQLTKYANEADTLICVGEPLKESLIHITGTGKTVNVVPNVVSSYFKPIYKNKSSSEFIFVVSGRIVPHKQFDGIIKAFASAFKGDDSKKLILIGGGKQLEYLKKLAKNSGVADQTEFTGVLSREEVAKRTAAADCLVCFSRLETFGVPVIEAWACGIPAIGTDSLGFLEYYNDSLGYIVRHDSVDELAKAMEKVAARKDSYSKEYISNFAKENFGGEAVYEMLIKAYNTC